MNKWLMLQVTIWVIWMTTISFAAITGKIRGKVVDSNTPEPLPGANVVITSVWVESFGKDFTTRLGAAAGKVVILRVPSGDYFVSAQMTGYSPFIDRTDQVRVDRTSGIMNIVTKNPSEKLNLLLDDQVAPPQSPLLLWPTPFLPVGFKFNYNVESLTFAQGVNFTAGRLKGTLDYAQAPTLYFNDIH